MVSPVGSVKRFKMHCILRSPLATRAPTSFCTSGYRRALLANSIYGVSKQTGFCKNRRVYIHLLCLLFVFPMAADAIFRMEIGQNAALPAQKRNRHDRNHACSEKLNFTVLPAESFGFPFFCGIAPQSVKFAAAVTRYRALRYSISLNVRRPSRRSFAEGLRAP